METLVVVGQQDQFHSRNRGGRNHGYSYSTNFREINCRSSFQSGPGVVASLGSTKNRSPPVTKPNSPKTPLVTPNNAKKQFSNSEQNGKCSKSSTRIVKSKSVPIVYKDSVRVNLNDGLFYSELWAGPAYSNSPPPSSLPIPKFSVKPKRTVSLELPSVTGGDIDLLGMFAKSAPASPNREHSKMARKDLFGGDGDDEFATKTLRRILNLDE
ncbi:hypothetical protein CTI12_AA222370 [Artemisia annua]|uniref:Uncharacterized protein n=1 Tax=Artemisia annua TaxID=35608 RepID=A0A2U1NW91_ARTAN|nr:hypothetical protein CTI12_AA222370 [Artemisia annua]